jgi:hypothetical protein
MKKTFLVMKKKVKKKKVTTRQTRIEKALHQLGKKNICFSEKEVVDDVKKAVAEVRASAKNRTVINTK